MVFPVGIQNELEAAVNKTGETAALELARRRITALLQMSPQEVERRTADLYKAMV